MEPPPGFESEISCEGPIGPSDTVAVVQLAGTPNRVGPTVMRDYADPANPRTVCEFGHDDVAQLVDARHVVINDCVETTCRLAVVDLPEVKYHWFELPEPGDSYSELFAVSPGLNEVAWTSSASDGTQRRLHLTRADGDHVVGDLRPVGGRCGSPDDSKRGAYTRSGEYLYILDVPSDTVFLVFAGGREVLSMRPPGEAPAMPVWSPTDAALYFRRAGDVWRWTPDAEPQQFLVGVGWRYPTISPDGRYLAYAVPLEDGSHDTYLMDLSAGTPPELIGHRRTMPVFITPTQLWLASEGQGVCGPGIDQRLIYDINERAESRSIIERVMYVWPTTSSNH